MDLKSFFLETINDLEDRLDKGSDYDLLQCSALLRKLLLDKEPLIFKIKKEISFSKPLRFTVIDYVIIPLQRGALFFEIPFSPELSRPLKIKEISFENFLKSPIFLISGKEYSVRESIKYLAHAEGGVHIDIDGVQRDLGLNDSDIANITSLQQYLNVSGNKPITRQIAKIAKVLINALEPLMLSLN